MSASRLLPMVQPTPELPVQYNERMNAASVIWITGVASEVIGFMCQKAGDSAAAAAFGMMGAMAGLISMGFLWAAVSPLERAIGNAGIPCMAVSVASIGSIFAFTLSAACLNSEECVVGLTAVMAPIGAVAAVGALCWLNNQRQRFGVQPVDGAGAGAGASASA